MPDYHLLEKIISRHSALFDQASVTDISVIETTSFNLIFFFQAGGKSFVLKVMKKGAKSEFTILQEAIKHIKVPKALSYGNIDDDVYLLLERTPGKDAQVLLPGLDKAAREKFINDSATVLAKLHRSTMNISGPNRLESSRLMNAEDVALKFAETGKPAWQGIAVLRAMEPQVELGQTCLVHGRFIPSNIMLDKLGISGILDWTESFWGSPFYDLGFTLFVLNSMGLNAGLFLRSYKDEWSKPITTDLNVQRSSVLPEGILEYLPYYETLAAIEFHTIGINARNDPHLTEILHNPVYLWTQKAIAAGDRVALKLTS